MANKGSRLWQIAGAVIGVAVIALVIAILTQSTPIERVDVPIEGAPMKGAPDAPVTIVEFSDFQCPYCAKAASTMKQIMEKRSGKVRIVFRHAPLASHKRAAIAAEASLAAHEQGKFWEYHDLLFERSREIGSGGDELLEEMAAQLELDMDDFRHALQSDRFEEKVREDRALLKKLDKGVVPTFYVNGRVLRGALPLERFLDVIDDEIARRE